MSIILIILFILILYLILRRREPPHRTVGRMGEEHTASLVKQLLHDDDIHLTNLEISYKGMRTELDNLVISKRGVTIIETKTYTGRIEGNAEDEEWDKYTISRSGVEYHKIIGNPITQVKRQVRILSGVLREHGVNIRVKGYVYFVFNNCPIEDEHIIHSVEELHSMLASKRRKPLTAEEIRSIVDALM